MTIDAAIAEAVAAKKFFGLSVVRTPSGRWQANLRYTPSVSMYATEVADAPEVAMLAVLVDVLTRETRFAALAEGPRMNEPPRALLNKGPPAGIFD